MHANQIAKVNHSNLNVFLGVQTNALKGNKQACASQTHNWINRYTYNVLLVGPLPWTDRKLNFQRDLQPYTSRYFPLKGTVCACHDQLLADRPIRCCLQPSVRPMSQYCRVLLYLCLQGSCRMLVYEDLQETNLHVIQVLFYRNKKIARYIITFQCRQLIPCI